MLNEAINSSIINTTTIPSARFSKANWLKLHLKHSILTGDSIVAGLSRYRIIWNGNFSFNILNCGIGGDKFQNIFWRAHNLRAVKSVRNVVILCGKNNLHLDASEDVDDGIIEIRSNCKRLYTNVFIFEVLSHDCYRSTNGVYIKGVNEVLRLKCVRFSFSYIGQDTNWTLINRSLYPQLFYSDKIHLAQKGNSK